MLRQLQLRVSLNLQIRDIALTRDTQSDPTAPTCEQTASKSGPMIELSSLKRTKMNQELYELIF